MGDGGCITTNDAALAEKLRMLRNHGRKTKYVHELVGYNLRFNEIQAAIGRIGLRKLSELNEHRRQVAARYNERLTGIVGTPPEKTWARAVYHMVRHPDGTARRLGRVFAEQGNQHWHSLSCAESPAAGHD